MDALEAKGHYEQLTDSWTPVFVTSFGSNHFTEGRKLIKSIADHYPDSKIIVYDIGLATKEVGF